MRTSAQVHDDAVAKLDPTTLEVYGYMKRSWEAQKNTTTAPGVATVTTKGILLSVPTLTSRVVPDAIAKLVTVNLVHVIDARDRLGAAELEDLDFTLPLWSVVDEELG